MEFLPYLKKSAEFEAHCDAEGWMEEHTFKHELWLAWEASRAALVIELPAERKTGDGVYWLGASDHAHNACLAKCRKAIEAAGVQTK